MGQKAPLPGRGRRIRNRYDVRASKSLSAATVYLFWISFHPLLDLFLCEWKLNLSTDSSDLIMRFCVHFMHGGGCSISASQTDDRLGSVLGQFLHQLKVKAHIWIVTLSLLFGG